MSHPPSPEEQPPTGANVVPTSDASDVQPTTPMQPSSESSEAARASITSLGEYARRAGQQAAADLGTPVIIQPPSPPPEAPTGRAEEQSVTRTELARQLEVSERTVDRWVDEGVLPAPVRQGRGRMATRFQADAALLYWQEQGEEARKERRARQRNRKSLPQDALSRESQSRRNRRPGGSS